MPDINEYPIGTVGARGVPDLRFPRVTAETYGAGLGRQVAKSGRDVASFLTVKQENTDQRKAREQYLNYADAANAYKTSNVDNQLLEDGTDVVGDTDAWRIDAQGKIQFENARQQDIFNGLVQQFDVNYMNSVRRHESEQTIKAEASAAEGTMGIAAQQWTDNPGDMETWLAMHSAILENIGAAEPGRGDDMHELSYRARVSKATRLGLELLAVTRPDMARQFLDQDTIHGTVRENLVPGDLKALENTLNRENTLGIAMNASTVMAGVMQASAENDPPEEAMTMQEAIEAMDEFPGMENPETKAKAISMLKDRVAIDKYDYDTRRKRVFSAAYNDAIDELSDPNRQESSIDVVERHKRRLIDPTPAQIAHFDKLLDTSKAPGKSNETLRQQLMLYAATDPDKFKDLDPGSYLPHMSTTQGKSVSDAQIQIRLGTHKSQKVYDDGLVMLNKALQDAGVFSTAAEENVRGIFQSWWDQEVKHGGRLPTKGEIRVEVGRIVGSGVLEGEGFSSFRTGGAFSDEEVRFFEAHRRGELDRFTLTAGEAETHNRLTPAIKASVAARVNAKLRENGIREDHNMSDDRLLRYHLEIIRGTFDPLMNPPDGQ